MSKRVANTRAKTARNGRIRIGWRKVRMLRQLEELEKESLADKLDAKGKKYFEAFKSHVRKVVPKQFMRRTQARG